MDLSGQASQARFASYVEALAEVIGHVDRAEPLNDYCVGLPMPGGRKSAEPMAAIVAPARVSANHQSLLHLAGQAPWPDEAVLQKIREPVSPGIERHGRIEAWIVDDTGFTKKGTHSAGVARQYCGRLGKGDNCQIAVTLSIANHSASLPIAYRLYLPETWANDAARRKKTHVPKDVRFKTKPQIALDQIRAAHAAGVAPGIVLADAGYGANSDFRGAKLARHRRHHGKAHRQENGANIRRNALPYNILASRPCRDPCGHACALGDREQSTLAAGYNLRRGSLPDKKRFLTLEPRHCSPHCVEYAQARHVNIIPQAPTPEGFRQPRLQGSVACLLTI